MDFTGLKIGADKRLESEPWGVKRIKVEQGLDVLETRRAGVVGWGGNSGFHAVNLAVQWGVKRIILVGFDMTLAKGVHWHGPHVGKLHNPTDCGVARWRERLDAQAPLLAGLGIEVINTSMASALQNYQKMTLEEALRC